MPLQTLEIEIGTETGAQPNAAILVMHGLGADGSDFVPVARQLDLAAVGPVRFVFPHAPVQPVTINGGYPMPAWYDLLGVDLVRREDEAGLRQSQAALDALIEQEKSRGIPANRIVLAGFSQGCAMALMTGLRHAQRLGGIVGLSGYLPLAATLADERSAANHDLPIFLAHGTQDAVVPIARALETRQILETLHYPVQWQTYPMAHSVCTQEIEDINQWLLGVLG